MLLTYLTGKLLSLAQRNDTFMMHLHRVFVNDKKTTSRYDFLVFLPDSHLVMNVIYWRT